MNQFGGDWTKQKIEIVVSYAKAFLTIMNSYPQFKIIYFDGFAGSGHIVKENEIESIKGAAIRILELDEPKTFDIYYFVEKDSKNASELRKVIDEKFPLKKKQSHVVNEDCNVKIKSLSEFLIKNKNHKTLMFIDPYGMSVDWSSITLLRNLGIDLWILVPTGIGIGRLLKNDGKISNAWLNKLEKFLGISKEEIIRAFYRKYKQVNLFDDDFTLFKEDDIIVRIHSLYSERLKTIFKKVSEPFVLKNSNNSIMFHFMMATNNDAALKIANDVVKKFKL